MVGYGATERPGDVVYGVPTWIRHVVDFLDALEIEKAHFVGNSMGGLVAMHIARLHPTRVDKLILMGAPNPGMTPTAGLAALRAYEPSPDNMRALLLENFAYDPTLITEDLVQERYEASARPEVHASYRAMFHDPRHTGNQLELTEDGVQSIAARTLVVHGAHDKVIPVEAGWHLSRLIPDADLHVFARCGHWTQIERSEEFNNLISDFLERK
jgi:pimeloyl-ACP methyl ester carboxylesterase